MLLADAPPLATLRALYLAHVGELRRFLRHRLGCSETAAELAQETFVRAYAYDCEALSVNARALLYRIAGNLATDHIRAISRLPVHASLTDLPEQSEPGSDLADPARVVAARQVLKRLAIAIEALPARCRRAFVLNRFDGLSYSQIAAELGIGVNAVEKLLVRALLRLREAV